MVGFIGSGPVVEEIDAVSWRVHEPIVYEGKRQQFVIPVGFRTDFASVPRVLVWLIPRYGAYTKAAILHDYVCRTGIVGPKDADGLFRRVLRESGVSTPQCWMMWAGVRAASRLAGATGWDVARFLLVLTLSVLFLAVPVLVVQVWLLLFWLVESAFWLGGRITTGVCTPPPRPKATIAE